MFSCSLVSIYCYNVQLFSCVLSLLIHNCCRRCLYILLHQVTLKINYWSKMLLSNSRIFITWEDDKLYPVCRQEFSIARAHTVMVPFESSLDYVIVALPVFNTFDPSKVLTPFNLLFCLLTNIKSLFPISCCNMQNKIDPSWTLYMRLCLSLAWV